jgi:hypothetical protein
MSEMTDRGLDQFDRPPPQSQADVNRTTDDDVLGGHRESAETGGGG